MTTLRDAATLLRELPAAAAATLTEALTPASVRDAAAALDQARREGRQLGLTEAQTEEVITAALDEARRTPDLVDWDDVRQTMARRAVHPDDAG